jgi:hypothetical protein
MYLISLRYRKISRTWTRRINAREKKWDSQIDALANAYLAWKHEASPVETTESVFTVQYVDIYGQFHHVDVKLFTHAQHRLRTPVNIPPHHRRRFPVLERHTSPPWLSRINTR